jgi:hypothetical protein
MIDADSVSTTRAIDQLAIDIDRARKAPPFRKLALAECALDTAVAVLRALNQRVADLETELME